jgi:hypothetical protein
VADNEWDGSSQPPSPADLRESERAFAEASEADERLPDIDFATFILSLSHSALVHLGDAPDPAGGAGGVDLTMARQTIDLLGLLQERTRGNLTGEEERILDQILFDLRMRYVEVAKRA